MDEYLVVITQGREDGGRAANLGAKLAITMQAMNYNVSIFLTLAGTRWAFVGTAEDVQFPDEPPAEEYFKAFTDNGGSLLICSPCLNAYCFIPTMDKSDFKQSLRDGARYVGLATVAEKLILGEATIF